jgi:hypothetical protein
MDLEKANWRSGIRQGCWPLHLKDKNITMEQFWPLPGDKKTGKAARKRLNQMTPEERKERIKAIAAHLNGITTNN